MENELVVTASAAAVAVVACALFADEIQGRKERRRRSPRKMWVRPIFREENRQRFGDYNLVKEMRLTDINSFMNYTRMSPEFFDKLLHLVGPAISKKKCNSRKAITPAVKLAVTLRYLASGNSQRSISFSYRLGYGTVNVIISETLREIYNCLHQKVLPSPTKQHWLEIAEGFKQRWNFPHCIGAIDGKHIKIQAPPHSGSEFYNYKNYFSIVLLAIADYRYRVVAMDIGAQGRQSDGGVFQNSVIAKRLANNALNVPDCAEIIKDGPFLPHYLLADEAFPLKTWLLTPYSGKSKGNLDFDKLVFNYRHSRARRIIENTFGIIVTKWRILKTSLETNLQTTEKIVQAVICLHNFCLMEEEHLRGHQKKYCPPSYVDCENSATKKVRPGEWRTQAAGDQLRHIGKQGSFNSSNEAVGIRNTLSEYFMTDGSVPWQWDVVI